MAAAPETTAEVLHRLTKVDRHTRIQINRSQIKNAPYNPRKMSPAAKIDLRKSLDQHGILSDPVWNRRTGNIVGGHQRIDQIDHIEGTQNYSLWVIVVDVDDRTEKAMNIALNNLNLQGEMDGEKIVEMFRAGEFDLEASGYKPLDIEYLAYESGLATELIDGLFTPEAKEQIDETASEIDDIIDQADELKRRKAGSRARSQPQDEDEQGDGESCDSEGDTIRFHEETGAGSGPVRDAEYFRSVRGKKSESQLAQQESGYYLTLVFGSNAQKYAFCDFLGIDQQQPHEDGPKVAEMLGCKLPELEGKRRKPKDEPEIEIANRGDV